MQLSLLFNAGNQVEVRFCPKKKADPKVSLINELNELDNTFGPLQLDDAQGHGLGNFLSALVHLQLLEDVEDMRFYYALALPRHDHAPACKVMPMCCQIGFVPKERGCIVAGKRQSGGN
jgi:hypothetical protein